MWCIRAMGATAREALVAPITAHLTLSIRWTKSNLVLLLLVADAIGVERENVRVDDGVDGNACSWLTGFVDNFTLFRTGSPDDMVASLVIDPFLPNC